MNIITHSRKAGDSSWSLAEKYIGDYRQHHPNATIKQLMKRIQEDNNVNWGIYKQEDINIPMDIPVAEETKETKETVEATGEPVTESTEAPASSTTTEDEETTTQESSSKPSKVGVYPVCNGAMCKCDKAEVNTTLAEFKVLKNENVYVNDKEGASKLIATNQDLPLPFAVKKSTFGKCKMQPTITGNLPCIPNIIQWEKSYEAITVQDAGTALIQESEGICMFGGTVTFETHGQTQTVTASNAAETPPEEAAIISGIADEEIIRQLQEGVFTQKDENTIDVEDITTTDTQRPEKKTYTYHLKATQIEFKAKTPKGTTEAQKKGINWVVYEKEKNKTTYKELYTYIDKGELFIFPYRAKGVYAVEAYGKNKKFKPNTGKGGKAYNLIEIKGQEIATDKGLEIKVGYQTRKRVRPVETATVSVAMLFPEVNALDNLIWGVTKNKIDITNQCINLQGSIQIPPQAKGTINITVSNHKGANTKSAKYTVGNNYAKAIKANKDTVAVHNDGEIQKERHQVTLEVTEFAINPATPAEEVLVKWTAYYEKETIDKKNPVVIATGKRITQIINKECELYVEAYVNTPEGSGHPTSKLVKAIQPKITKGYWADKNGNKISKSGYGHQVYIHIETEGLVGEKLQLKVWEAQVGNDTYKENAGTEIEITDMNGIINQAYTIPKNNKAGLSENSKYEFFFTIEKLDFAVQNTAQDPEADNQYIILTNKVKEKKVEKLRPHYLHVNDDKKIVSLKIYEDTGKLHTGVVKYGDTVTIKMATRNMINEELEFEIWKDAKQDNNTDNYSFYDTRDDVKYSETIKIKIDNEGNGEITFAIPTTWENLQKTRVELFYFKETKSKVEFPRAYYFKNPNTQEKDKKETEKQNKKRIYALMLKVSNNLELDKGIEEASAVMLGEELTGGVDGNCGGNFCIRKDSDKESKLIQEINIRLAGFGGNIPTKTFTSRTFSMVKQFQKDYMEIEPTGNICGSTLKAIDEFCENWSEEITTHKCLCHASDSKVKIANRCPGYGKGKKNEHPGMHRTLLWGVSALKFYLSKQDVYKYRRTSAGYRCWVHNIAESRETTNHMGKAVDIQFNKNDFVIRKYKKNNIPFLKEIASAFYKKKLKAKEGWGIKSKKNGYRLEPIGKGKDESYSWIHMDVTAFEADFLLDEFFTKEQSTITGKKIIEIAKNEGYTNTCECLGGFRSSTKKETSISTCSTCNALDKERIDFYNQVGESSINFVKNLSKANKFKGLYMVAQRRQENGFHLVTPGNNPMNIKGKGDLGQVELNTHEYINGKKTYMKDGFAKFSTMEKGFEGYSNLLDKNFNNAYLALKDDSNTIDDFLSGLQNHGRIGSYATDPNYKSNIKNIFNGVVKDYKKWLNCKLSCNSFDGESIKNDIKLLEKLK